MMLFGFPFPAKNLALMELIPVSVIAVIKTVVIFTVLDLTFRLCSRNCRCLYFFL